MVDEARVSAFDAEADDWWNPAGSSAWLHRYNLVRIPYIRQMACARFGRDYRDNDCLHGLTILDAGCGGGVLCEPLSRLGARVTGIDPGARVIARARHHARSAGMTIDYACATPEMLAAAGARFDVVLSMEVIEHVPDREQFVRQCATLVKPGGLLIMSTINRTPKSLLYAIVLGEYILRLLPPRTHRWSWFVRPEEIARVAASAGLVLADVTGISWSIPNSALRLSNNTAVNYMLCLARPPTQSKKASARCAWTVHNSRAAGGRR